MSESKAWFDILTPKQVLFFGPIIEELESAGVEVLATSRRYRELEPLAVRAGLKLQFVGERGGKGREEQLVAATKRQAEMIPLVKEFGPNVAVSLASGVCARIAFGFGVKHIAVNDSPHSEVAGRLSIPLSYHLLCPWVIPFGSWSRFGLQRRQITRYHALDPAVWLKRKPLDGPIPRLDKSKKTITVRLEESDAPYLAEAKASWKDALLGSLIDAFPNLNIVALCRYDYQVEEVKSKFGSKCIVPDQIVGGQQLLAKTDLFVGMGGTMNAEAALMGVPTISAFQGRLYTDAYLESVGLLVTALKAKELLRYSRRFLHGAFKKKYEKVAGRVLSSMEDPVPKISLFVKRISEQG